MASIKPTLETLTKILTPVPTREELPAVLEEAQPYVDDLKARFLAEGAPFMADIIDEAWAECLAVPNRQVPLVRHPVDDFVRQLRQFKSCNFFSDPQENPLLNRLAAFLREAPTQLGLKIKSEAIRRFMKAENIPDRYFGSLKTQVYRHPYGKLWLHAWPE